MKRKIWLIHKNIKITHLYKPCTEEEEIFLILNGLNWNMLHVYGREAVGDLL